MYELATQKLVCEKRGEVVTTSLIVANSIGYDHWKVTRLIERHKSDFEDFGLINFESCLVKERSAKVYNLNRGQFMLLVTYLRTTKKASAVNELKKEMVKAFDSLLNFIRHKQSEEYKQTLSASKESQKQQMSLVGRGQPKENYIKPNSIACHAVRLYFDLPYKVKKEDMTAEQLVFHAECLQNAVALMVAQKLGVEIKSVSEIVYARILQMKS